ncbi:hypothetical protein DFJ58DRAFT_912518 [Suillus subalutaceus]|uniref:uncharacterized protein n=1 Tax=Suillus subalutaceus TaxID=48586 RepID=UPI001B8606C6|nr:uncharacterized protein DFJ58DRAFT_912518 [Suillus subalutaceus]KAG1862496.1 hypothetical protein DFJ58DRAFT_912518 [Suillus subalutaceus]
MHQDAPRVHFFTVTSSQLSMTDDHVMEVLMSASSPTSLFPNLRRLHWLDDREYFFPLLCTFLGSTITSIRELDGVCVGDSAESADATHKVLSGLRELSCLHTGTLSPQEFLRLASLLALKSLYFRLNTHEVQSNSTPAIIPQLDQVHLTVSMQYITVAGHFFGSMRLTSCRSATVYTDYDDLSYDPEVLYDPLHILNLIVSLSECLSPALEKLDIELEYDLAFIRGDIANRSYALGFNLELFHFGGAAGWLVSPSMTFTALVHLIQHCLRLHAVRMSFYATPVDYDNNPFFFETIPNEKITMLSVVMSPISGPCAVAYMLLRLLPKLERVDFCRWLLRDAPVPPLFKQSDDDWIVVNEILAAKNKIGNDRLWTYCGYVLRTGRARLTKVGTEQRIGYNSSLQFVDIS